MKNRFWTSILGVVAISGLLVAPAYGAPDEASLYERLGGYDAVSAVVDDFAAKLFDDPIVGARFFGMGEDSREGFRRPSKLT